MCLTVPKIIVGEPISASLISGTEKFWIRGGGVSRFSVEIFCLIVMKIIGGEPFRVSLIPSIENC